MTTPMETTGSTHSANSNSQQSWADPLGERPSVVEEISDGDAQSILLQPFSTLDEPVRETIMRDVRAVVLKLKVVMRPLDRQTPFGYMSVSQETDNGEIQLTETQRIVIEHLRDWDLWGPLLVCLTLSVLLSLKAPTHQASAVFAAVFCAVWIGSSVITVNAQLLGSNISFFQSVCVLGYSVFPMTVAAFVIGVLRLAHLWYLDILWIVLGFVWATRAAVVFIGMYIKPQRRALAVFPVFFFYIFLGWLILLF